MARFALFAMLVAAYCTCSSGCCCCSGFNQGLRQAAEQQRQIAEQQQRAFDEQQRAFEQQQRVIEEQQQKAIAEQQRKILEEQKKLQEKLNKGIVDPFKDNGIVDPFKDKDKNNPFKDKNALKDNTAPKDNNPFKDKNKRPEDTYFVFKVKSGQWSRDNMALGAGVTGIGAFKNNPKTFRMSKTGAIPQGDWRVSAKRTDPGGEPIFDITFFTGGNVKGRTDPPGVESFTVHAENSPNAGQSGITAPRNVRDQFQIGNLIRVDPQ